MNKFLPPDYHMHTHNSGDSKAPMEEMILSSIKRGLTEICFTEHLDLNYPLLPDLPPNAFDLDVESYRNEYLHYKEKYAGQIILNFGVEIGMQDDCVNENTAFIKNGDFDFVIASQHLLNKRDPFYSDFWEADTVDNIFKKYFEVTLEDITYFTDFDVLGHIDYISRYVPKGDHTYSYERYNELIDAILEQLIRHDKGLDLNSKVLAYTDMNLLPNPCPEIIKRFKDMGGKIITFGSDAHTPDRVATHFEDMVDIVRSCGFTEYYTFKKRIPTAHKLL